MTKAAVRHDEKTGAKERIMEAAEKLFAGQGYAATSVAEIAQAASANRALLYYYFQDKRDLYWAIIERGLQEVLHLVNDAYQWPGAHWDRVERFVRSYCELLESRHNFVQIVIREMTGGGERLGLPIEKHVRNNVARVRMIFEEGVRNGEFQGLDPELTASSLFGMIHVFFTQSLTTRRRHRAKVVVAHTLQLLRQGACGLRGPGVHSHLRNAKRKA